MCRGMYVTLDVAIVMCQNVCAMDTSRQGIFNYSVEHMVEAFRPERIGEMRILRVIGAGETLIPPEVVPFVKRVASFRTCCRACYK